MWSGCRDTFLDPFQNEDKYYTVYGFLDPLVVEQKIRVIPVTRFPEDIRSPSSPQAVLDAKVFTRDVLFGRVTEWVHGLERLDDGRFAHVFTANFAVKAGHTYRLEIQRSDGVITSAETTVPRVATDNLLLKSGPVQLSDSSIIQDIGIPDVPALWDVSVIYLVEGSSYRERIFVPYAKAAIRDEDGLWRVQLNLSEDQNPIKERALIALRRTGNNALSVSLTAMGMQFRIIDGAWFSLFSETDILKLAQPGTFSNVENGYGLFGSMGLYREEWQIQPDLSHLLGYPLRIEVQ